VIVVVEILFVLCTSQGKILVRKLKIKIKHITDANVKLQLE